MRFLLLYLVLGFFPVQSIPESPLAKASHSLAEEATLVVFLQADKDQYFKQTCWPLLVDFAQSNGIQLIEKMAQEGMPKELTSTPVIVFQNFRGRSIYAGRYATFSTIKNFIRTSRRIPQVPIADCRQELLAGQQGRGQVRVPVKITPLRGQIPQGHQGVNFQQTAVGAIQKGLQQLHKVAEVCSQKTDRTFYFDFHPYLDQTGRCFVSAEVYIQFSCISPIWSNLQQGGAKSYENFEAAFMETAREMEAAMWRQLREAENGDALNFLPDTTPVKSWEALDLVLPAAPTAAMDQKTFAFEWATHWSFQGAVDDFTPVIQFRFPAPLERYAGEVRQVEGQLQLGPNQDLQSGFFEVDTKSLTMGIADFDAKIHKEYIKVKKYPKSSFSFGPLRQLPPLKIGEPTAMQVPGVFELMKKKQALMVQTEITPTFDEAGQSVLQVAASFSINITDDFQIKGPDGPAPARKTLLFNLNFFLHPTN